MDEIADCVEHNVDQVKEDIVKMVSGIPVETELNGYSAVEQQLENRRNSPHSGTESGGFRRQCNKTD